MAKSAPIKNSEQILTVLAEDIRFRGELQFKDSLQINGKFEGKINTVGHLIISEKSTVKAEIEANQITVSGSLVGNIVQANSVRINNKGQVQGDIHSKEISIDAGAKFNGTCIMGNTTH